MYLLMNIYRAQQVTNGSRLNLLLKSAHVSAKLHEHSSQKPASNQAAVRLPQDSSDHYLSLKASYKISTLHLQVSV